MRDQGPLAGKADRRTKPIGPRRLLRALLIVVALVAAVLVAGMRPGDPTLYPPRGVPAGTVDIVSHGLHAGIAIERALLVDLAEAENLSALKRIAALFPEAKMFEIGWGDEGFYRGVPTLSDLSFVEGLRALLRPGNASVLHVVGLPWPTRVAFPRSEIVTVALSREGLRRLARRLDASFIRAPDGSLSDLGGGLYGPSLFFRAEGTFNIFRVCNHWIAGLLNAAGVSVNMVVATHPAGLLNGLR